MLNSQPPLQVHGYRGVVEGSFADPNVWHVFMYVLVSGS